jgi:molecular chaperone HscB
VTAVGPEGTAGRDDFELFGLPRRFALDAADLDERRRRLLAEVHPDRHAAGGTTTARRATERAMDVNEAWRRLRDPQKRATRLLELNGVAVDGFGRAAMPARFLGEQMGWREALETARTRDGIAEVQRRAAAERAAALRRLEEHLDAGRWNDAADEVRALPFHDRFAAEVDARLAALPPDANVAA